MISVKGNEVHGVKFFLSDLAILEKEWEKAKNLHKEENAGVVIVVFKTVECVENTILELELVK